MLKPENEDEYPPPKLKKIDSKLSNLENSINQTQASAYFPKRKKIQINKNDELNIPPKHTGLNVLNSNSLQTPVLRVPSNVKREPVDTNTTEETPSKKLKWEPNNWREQFERIKEMRVNLDAPVDTMGCETLNSCDQNQPENVKRFHILVSLMLSSQTKDEVTAKAMEGLYKLPLNIDTILATEEEVIEKAIYPASFYKRKAQYIKRTCQLLKDKYNYDIPDNVDELCKLPGVGPKMAYICMSAAWKNTVGIGVDTHVHRISNRLGWTRTQTKLPEQTRKELEDWLPECHWDEVNRLLVGFGQLTCRPVGPKCEKCLCSDICPTGKLEISNTKAKASNKSKKINLHVEETQTNKI